MRDRVVMLLAWALALGPSATTAQESACRFRGAPDALVERASPPDSVPIPLGDGQAKLCYGRPRAGSEARVGSEFPFGTPWEMGANEPTTLHLPFPARVGGVDLPPGSYSLYAIPGAESWTIVVNGNPDRWGEPINADVRAADVGAFTAEASAPEDHVERLTFRFRPEGPAAGTLEYAWEWTTLAIPVIRR